jgi:hypothetical protein
MCRATNGQVLTNKDQVLSIWKEPFEQHLNEGSKEKPHANQNHPRKNVVNPIKYRKDNKAAGSDNDRAVKKRLTKSGECSRFGSTTHYLKARPMQSMQCTRRATHLIARIKFLNRTQISKQKPPIFVNIFKKPQNRSKCPTLLKKTSIYLEII